MQSSSVSLGDFTFSSSDLVFTAAVLLAFASLLLIFSSRRKVALQESLVTEELLILLSRIAQALEVQAARTPDKLIADLTAALRQQPTNLPQPTPPPQTREAEPAAGPMRFPLYTGELPRRER